MATRDTIVIGASAGGVQALSSARCRSACKLTGCGFHSSSYRRQTLPACCQAYSHVSRTYRWNMPSTVSRSSDADESTSAPPDHHLLIEEEHVKLVHGPKENLHRPSIDALFRSAARWAGPRVIGVVLTGARDDGRVGMRAIQKRGGITIVQDPAEAAFPSMPLSVMQGIKVDYSLPLSEIGPLLYKLSQETAEEEGRYAVPDDIEIEARIAEQEMESSELIASVERLGKISKLDLPGLSWCAVGNSRRRHTEISVSRGTRIFSREFERRTITHAGGCIMVCREGPRRTDDIGKPHRRTCSKS